MAPAWLLVLAIAAPTDVLRWRAPPQCPDAAVVQTMVEAHLGRGLDGVDVEIDAVVEQFRPALFQLTLEVAHAGVRHERTLLAEQCESLARASALVIALGIDAVAVAGVEGPRMAPTSVSVPSPAAERESSSIEPEAATPRVTSAVARQPRRRPQLVLALAGGLERGAVPGITGGIDGAIGLRGRGFRFELAGTWLGPRTAEVPEASVRVQLGVVAIRGCPELTLGPVSFPLCIGLELGAMRGTGDRATDPRTAHGLWLAPTISPGLRVGARAVALVARGEVAIAPVRPAFELSEPGEPISVFAPPPVSARLWLGIEFRLGRRDGSTP